MMCPGAVQHRATRKIVKATAARWPAASLDHFSFMRASELGRDGETALSTEQRNKIFQKAWMAGSSPAMTSER
jgi:hypothetical protein